MSVRILQGDCREMLATIAPGSVQCCVTSPPYFGLRNYGVDGQIGLEPTPDAYVAEMVSVFRGVRDALRDDGTLWLNLGDSYANDGKWGGSSGGKHVAALHGNTGVGRTKTSTGMKPKDLLGIPWRVAFALQADGWYLRSDIVWHKPNPMPESVTDRPTSSYEMVFLMTKAAKYFYDAGAIAEPISEFSTPQKQAAAIQYGSASRLRNDEGRMGGGSKVRSDGMRNARNVWTIATSPTPFAHFATMPPKLAERCIKAGSKPGDTILDPFGGAGTTGLVADRLGRDAVLIELNPQYSDIIRDRINDDAGLFASVA